MGIKTMILNIVTGQIKQPHFLSQASEFCSLSLDGEPPQNIIEWTKNDENENGCFFGRKLIISASILLRKSCLGSELGDLRSGNPFM